MSRSLISKYSASTIALVAATLLGASEAWAQEVAQIETVTVTAEKRVENIQSVPSTVTAVSGDQIQSDSSIQTSDDIISLVPNANAAATDGRDRPRWFIRGVGTNNTDANGVSPVGIYRDEVYTANFYAQDFPLFDTQRVEVLSGPQGTLWGKNTTGGAINYISQAPTFDNSGYFQAQTGSYGLEEVEGAVGTSLIDDVVAGRLSFYDQNQGGWVRNLYDGRNWGANHDFAARGQLLFTPLDSLQVLVSAHARTYSGDQEPGEYKADPLAVPATYVATAALPTPYNLGYTTLAGLPYATINASDPGSEKINNFGGLVRVNWNAPGGYAITSISGYDLNTLQRQAWGSGAIPLGNAVSKTTVPDREWSEELRVASPTGDQLSWIAGLYYFNDVERSDGLNGNITVIPATVSGSAPLSWNRSQQATNTNSRAVFGSATYKITDDLSVTAGARYNSESKNFALNYSYAAGTVTYSNPGAWYRPDAVGSTGGIVTQFNGSQGATYSHLTYDATLSYQVSDKILTYFRYSNGFLSGGIDAHQVAVNNYNIGQYAPESIHTYEAGAKTSWLDDRLVADGSLFYYDYPSIQVLIITPSTGANTSQSSSSASSYTNAAGWVQGAEFTLQALPWDPLLLRASVGFLDTKYTSFPTTTINGYNAALLPGGVVPQPAGNEFSRAPHWTVYIGGEYTIGLDQYGALKLGADYRYLSHQYFSPTIEFDPTLQQNAYGLANAHVTWAFGSNERFALTGSVENLGNQQYLTHAIAPSNAASSTRQGEPRTYNVTLSVKL